MEKRGYVAILVMVFSCMSLVCCDVHEFPDKPKVLPFVLNLDFDTEMPLHKVIDIEAEVKTKSDAAASEPEFDVRYIVNAYDSEDENSREVLHHFVFTKDDISELDNNLELNVIEGTYRFVVWTDYVQQGSEDDLYYNTEKFENITLVDGEHSGSNDMRDAFMGTVTAEVSDESAGADVIMTRPMAKFNFITTDVYEFVDEQLARRGVAQQGLVDVEDYTIVFRYNGFMPDAYNLHTASTANAGTGVSFSSKISALEGSEAELGFDYVFVNNTETKVSVAVEVYDLEGKMLSGFKPVDVPLMRSKLTTVKAEFLTSKAGGGVSVSPDYEGDHNVVIE